MAGTGLGAWCARYLRAYLFGVTPWDAPTFLLTLVVAVMIAVVTALGPANRANRVDSMVVLRCE